MKWLRKFFYQWMQKEAADSPLMVSTRPAEIDDNNEKISFTILKATNGRIIQVGRYKLNPRGNDWTYQNYIVREGETLGEAFLHLTVAHELEK